MSYIYAVTDSNPGMMIDPNGTVTKEAFQPYDENFEAYTRYTNLGGNRASLAYYIIGAAMNHFGFNGWRGNDMFYGNGGISLPKFSFKGHDGGPKLMATYEPRFSGGVGSFEDGYMGAKLFRRWRVVRNLWIQ